MIHNKRAVYQRQLNLGSTAGDLHQWRKVNQFQSVHKLDQLLRAGVMPHGCEVQLSAVSNRDDRAGIWFGLWVLAYVVG